MSGHATIEAFRQYLAYERRSSPLTVQGYLRDVGVFVAFVTEHRGQFEPGKVDRRMLRRYLSSLHRQGLNLRQLVGDSRQ